MKEQELKRHLNEIAREAIPDISQPWSILQARMQASAGKPTQKGFSMKTQNISTNTNHRSVRVAAIVVLAMLAVGAVFLVTPQGRALAQSVMHFFIHTTTDIIPGPTEAPHKWVIQTPGVPAATITPLPSQPGPAFKAECGGFANPKCTIEEIRSKVPFPVLQIAQIPDGFYFVGGTGGKDGIYLTYEAKNQGGALLITEMPWTGSLNQKRWEVGASANIESVKVGDVMGEYVKGSYDGNHNPAVWNPNLDVQNLHWINREIIFTLMKSGSEPPLSRDALTTLAGNLTTAPVAASTRIVPTEKPTEDPVSYLKETWSLSVEQAAKESGIPIHQPVKLPDVLTLFGASVEPDQKSVSVFYLFDQNQWGPNTDGLTLTEQVVPKTGDCGLCGMIVGDGFEVDKHAPGQVVGKDAKIETVTIGNTPGQYVEGNWQNYTDCCGWTWSSDPYLKHLRWQGNGMAYELAYMGMGISKEDMIAIAESIK